MKVERTIVVENVTKCEQCPYFSDHPHEPSCQLKEERGAKGWDTICSRREIDPLCPIAHPNPFYRTLELPRRR